MSVFSSGYMGRLHFDKGAESVRRRHAALVKKAEVALVRGDLAAARNSLHEVLNDDAEHIGALEISAKLYWKLEDFEEVRRITDRLITLNPFEPGYHGLRGMALRGLNRYGEAAQALARDPQATEALLELEGYQASLVKNLLEEDPVFAAQYAKNPQGALSDRGFYFARNDAASAWLADNVENSVLMEFTLLSRPRPS